MPPARALDGEEAAAEDDIQVFHARTTRRHRPDHGATALGATALVIAAAALALYVAWPQMRNMWQVAARRNDPAAARQPNSAATTRLKPNAMPDRKPEPLPESKPAPKSAPKSEPVPQPAPKPSVDPKPEAKPEPRPQPEPSPGVTPLPTPAEPEPPAVDVEKVRALVGTAVSKACESLRQHDFAAAKQELAAVAERALDDQQATDRLQRWQQLTVYAEGYPEHRDNAFNNALKGREFEVDGRRVGVAEGEKPGTFSIRDRGRNRTVTRDSMPPKLEHAIVAQWFAADGRPANHLFLGAAAIARREPDLGTARKEWATAAAGGERAGTLLLEILDDPVLRGR